MANNISNNKSRITKKLPQAGITTDALSPINPYSKEFGAGDSHVTLALEVRDSPTKCTVNPPRVDNVSFFGKFHKHWEGTPVCTSHGTGGGSVIGTYLGDAYAPTEEGNDYTQIGGFSVIDGYRDSLKTSTSIVVPEAGCYYIHAKGSGQGVSYFASGSGTGLSLLHNGYVIDSASWDAPTGAIILLGPWIYFWPKITNLYGVIEAKQGDTITVSDTSYGFEICYGWVGTYLRGAFWGGITELEIKLIASAENISVSNVEPDIEYEEGTVVDPTEALVTLRAASSAQAVIL